MEHLTSSCWILLASSWVKILCNHVTLRSVKVRRKESSDFGCICKYRLLWNHHNDQTIIYQSSPPFFFLAPFQKPHDISECPKNNLCSHLCEHSDLKAQLCSCGIYDWNPDSLVANSMFYHTAWVLYNNSCEWLSQRKCMIKYLSLLLECLFHCSYFYTLLCSNGSSKMHRSSITQMAKTPAAWSKVVWMMNISF